MIAETAAAIASLKHLGDTIRSMKEGAEKRNLSAALQDAQTKFISLQSIVMASQHAQAAAEERARQAEEKCMQLEDWERQAGRYELKALAPGFFAYSAKPGMESGEPLHYLCANCFSRRQKSIVQTDYVLGDRVFVCHNCGVKVHPQT